MDKEREKEILDVIRKCLTIGVHTKHWWDDSKTCKISLVLTDPETGKEEKLSEHSISIPD